MSDSEAKKKGGANEEEIATKMLTIGYKRFYVDVKQNSRGRFIKIAEMGVNHKSRVVLSMSAAQSVAEKLGEYIAFCESTPEDPKKEQTEDRADLRADVLNFDSRRYYLDLKENQRGRFLRIAQTNTIPRPTRSQVAIPASGLGEVMETIVEYIAKHGEGYMDPPSELADSKLLRTELNKTFYFDSCQNDRGSFVRISEVKPSSGYRTSITIPSGSLAAFRETLSELIEKLDLDNSNLKTEVET